MALPFSALDYAVLPARALHLAERRRPRSRGRHERGGLQTPLAAMGWRGRRLSGCGWQRGVITLSDLPSGCSLRAAENSLCLAGGGRAWPCPLRLTTTSCAGWGGAQLPPKGPPPRGEPRGPCTAVLWGQVSRHACITALDDEFSRTPPCHTWLSGGVRLGATCFSANNRSCMP